MNFFGDKFKAAGSSIKSGVNFAAREIKADFKALTRTNPAKAAFVTGHERPNVKDNIFTPPRNQASLTRDIGEDKISAAKFDNAFAL